MKTKMEKVKQLHSQANRLIGEFIGTLEGITHHDIPQWLSERLNKKIQELKDTEIINPFQEEVDYKNTNPTQDESWYRPLESGNGTALHDFALLVLQGSSKATEQLKANPEIQEAYNRFVKQQVNNKPQKKRF